MRLTRLGEAHWKAPDKVPSIRLRTLEEAGQLSMAFTTGILIGIGETLEERVEDMQRLDEPQERGYFERVAAWPTLTINGIHGGYGGPGSKTVLPREAVAKCDIRLVRAQTAEEMEERKSKLSTDR